jgi:hypothetical protein
VALGDEHALEARGIEHRGDADVSRANVDAAAVRVDRVRLDAGGSGPAGGVNDAVEKRSRNTVPSVSGSDAEAADRPHRQVVDAGIVRLVMSRGVSVRTATPTHPATSPST